MSIALTCDERGATGTCEACGAGPNEHCAKHPMNPANTSTVPCKWCGVSTRMLGTKMCDNCWEMDDRVQRNPIVAQRMLRSTQPKGSSCLVTGILLHDVSNNRYCHADLFGFGLVYVLECAEWIYGSPDPTCKLIALEDWRNVYFKERSNGLTVVVHVCDAELNDRAKAYLAAERV